MTTTTPTPTSTPRTVRRAGAWCLGGGLLGATQGLVVLAWSPQVSEERFSYPFNALWYVVAELSFVLQHVMLVAGGLALLWLPAVRASRTARIATRAAVTGLVLLVVMELSALSLYDAASDSDSAIFIATLFLLPVMLIGVGLTVAGIALLRRGTAGWAGRAGCPPPSWPRVSTSSWRSHPRSTDPSPQAASASADGCFCSPPSATG